MAILFSAGTVLTNSNPRVLLNEKLLLCLDAFAPAVDLRIGLDDRGRWSCVCSAVQCRSIQVASLAQHRSISGRPHARHRRGAVDTECVLHGPGERRSLEDGRLRYYLEANL